MNEGYFVVEVRVSTAGRYLGSTFSVKTSGRMMTNERPCGNQVTTSPKVLSFSIAMRRCGKISRLLRDVELGACFKSLEQSSTTPQDCLGSHATGSSSQNLADTSLSFVSAVAASTRWESPPVSPERHVDIMIEEQKDCDLRFVSTSATCWQMWCLNFLGAVDDEV